MYGVEWDAFCNDLEMTLYPLNKYRMILKVMTVLFWLSFIISIVAIAFEYDITSAGWTDRNGLIFVTLAVPALVGVAMLVTAWYIHRRLYSQTWIQVRLLAENFTVTAKDPNEDGGKDEEYGTIQQQHDVTLLLCDDQSGEASKVYNGKHSTSFFSIWSIAHNLYLQLSISPSHTAMQNNFDEFPVVPLASIQISSVLRPSTGSTLGELSRFSSIAADSIYTSSSDGSKKTRRRDDGDNNDDIASLPSVNFLIKQSREGKSTKELSSMYAHSPWHEDKTKFEEEKEYQEQDDDIERELYESNLVESMEKSKTTSTSKKSNRTTIGKKHRKKTKKTTASTNKMQKKDHKKHSVENSVGSAKMAPIAEEDEDEHHHLEERQKEIRMELTFPLSPPSLPSKSQQSQSPNIKKTKAKKKKKNSNNQKESLKQKKKTKKDSSSTSDA